MDYPIHQNMQQSKVANFYPKMWLKIVCDLRTFIFCLYCIQTLQLSQSLLSSTEHQTFFLSLHNTFLSVFFFLVTLTKKKIYNFLFFSIDKFDEEVSQDGARILIDKKAQLSLLGTEMDYVENKLSAEFVFNNPNIKGTCGCGESFSL